MAKQNVSQTIWVGLSFLVVGLIVGLFVSGVISGQSGQANLVGPGNGEVGQGMDLGEKSNPSFVKADGPIMGDPDAPITIVEFSDYQCPYCSRFHAETLPKLKEAYIDTGLVKLVYRDFPLSGHAQADEAAEAAHCVGLEGGADSYYAMHDILFERQSEWSGQSNVEEILVSYAEELGYDIDTCLESGQMAGTVNANFSAGLNYGVTGTPTFFIEGEVLVGAQPFEVFEAYLDAALAAKGL